ncbi:MAG: CHAT domain-containing protein [Bacteroidota bacterium]
MKKFLFSAANSTVAKEQLNLPATKDKIRHAFPHENSCYQYEWIDDVTVPLLSDAFRSPTQTIVAFQFSGHGSAKQLSFMRPAAWHNQKINARSLAEFFGLQPSLTLVVFDSCNSVGLARACIDAGVPIAIGTNHSLQDAASLVFNQYFWGGIVAGRSISHAFEEAKQLYITENNRFLDQPSWELIVNPNKPDAAEHAWDFEDCRQQPQQMNHQQSIMNVQNTKVAINEVKGDFTFNESDT